MLQHLEHHRHTIWGSLNNSVTARMKNDVWDVISQEMAGTGRVVRGPAELKRQKEKLTGRVRAKVSTIKIDVLYCNHCVMFMTNIIQLFNFFSIA